MRYITAVLAAFGLLAAMALPAGAEYGGVRWQHANRAVCVSVGKLDNAAIKAAVKESVAKFNDNTKLDVRVRSDCHALGYSQRVAVYDHPYGKNGWGAWTTYEGGFSWGPVRTTGPWTQNGYTWRIKSPVIIRMNQSYSHDARGWSHIASHELGHALGLGHVTRTCKAVMTVRKDCGLGYRNSGWWDHVGTVEYPGINQLYRNG